VTFELIAVGTSWGGLVALRQLFADLPDQVEQPIVVAQHRSADAIEGGLARALQHGTGRVVRDAEDKDSLEPSHVYLAPPDYHLLVERGSLALSTDAAVNHARPSIDVLFETAADAYGETLVGIVLTGANADGAQGLKRIKQRGGVAVVQDPATSERRRMPDAALALVDADAVLPLEAIGGYVYDLCSGAVAS
jgi:two-component system chemotaxis response regulator CheB